MLTIATAWAHLRYRIHSALAEWHAIRFQKHWRAAGRAAMRIRGADIEKYQSIKPLEQPNQCSEREAQDERAINVGE